jgi:hypothetical protein
MASWNLPTLCLKLIPNYLTVSAYNTHKLIFIKTEVALIGWSFLIKEKFYVRVCMIAIFTYQYSQLGFILKFKGD